MRDRDSVSVRVYRLLLRLYPAGFREAYGSPMEREFLDQLKESQGPWEKSGLWLRLVLDLAISLPEQFGSELRQDAKHTFRLWAKRPWQTAFAVVALATGIGATTGVFSVVNGLILRSLPFREPRRLASTDCYLVPHDTAAQFETWRTTSAYLDDAALYEQIDFNLGDERSLLRAHVTQASWNFFSLLGTQPLVGRSFGAAEEQPGHTDVAVIGYGLWQQLFAGQQRAVGAVIRVNGNPLTIIGVMPEGFDFPDHTALWKAADYTRGNNGWDTVGRLKPGVGWPQARAAFLAEMTGLSPDHKLKQLPAFSSLADRLAGPVKTASLLLLAGVGMILLIACTNIASLLLARNTDRMPELAIRSAVGASRARLIQQLLTECILLSLTAALAGFAVAYWVVSLANKIQPVPLATQSYSILDSHVLLFAAGGAIFSGLLFGILPAFQAARVDGSLDRSLTGTRKSRLLRETLVAAQVMLTLVLLTASFTVGRALIQLMQVDRGYDPAGLVTVNVATEGSVHNLPGRQIPYFEEVLARIRSLPAVRSASATDSLPLYATGGVGGPFGLDGRPGPDVSTMIPVLGDYCRTMAGRILYGREFTDADVRTHARVAVVSNDFARQFGRPVDVIGHEVTLEDEPRRRIIGVVKGMEYMVGQQTAKQVFVPAETPGAFYSAFVARVNGDPQRQVAAVRDTIRSVDPKVPVFGAKTMKERLDEALARPRFYRTALSFFAAFALFIAVIGIFGTVSYTVAQRTREMAVRLALGTTAQHIRATLLGQSLIVVAAGAAAGVVGAAIAGRFLQAFVEGARSLDILSMSTSGVAICLIAAISTWAATRRIAQLEIMEILRLV